MSQHLRIIIAHPDEATRRTIADSLAKDCTVIASCSGVVELTQVALAECPDLIITGVVFPDGDGLDTVIGLGRERPIPAVVVTASRSMELVTKAVRDHVMSYLIEPVQPEELQAAVVVAWTRFRQLSELEEQVGDLKRALEQRKVIERAKGILMASEEIAEPEAFRRLRREAQDRRRPMAEIAAEIIARTGDVVDTAT